MIVLQLLSKTSPGALDGEEDEQVGVTVANPGGFIGCPETPPPGHDFFNEGDDTVTGTDLH